MAQTSSLPPTAPPEIKAPSAWVWARKNLFSTWYNSIISIVCLFIIVQGTLSFTSWVFGAAQWEVIGVNLRLFLVGQFPPDLYWRIWMCLAMITGLAGISWGFASNAVLFSRSALIALGVIIAAIVIIPIELSQRFWLLAITLVGIGGYGAARQLPAAMSRWLTLAWGLAFLVILWFIKGGLGLEVTPTSVWSGLLLSLFTAVVSIALSFPLGLMLALGRQSELPVVRWFSILYIEVIRGLPLIGILFLAQVMLPLFLPPELTRLDRVLRAIAGLVLFNAAYLAENVRGGLQSLPRGQAEAGRALGLSGLLVTLLIVLPQALRAVIPSLVGEFIGLFKDTSLLALFGLLELTGIARSILAQPQFLGRYAEVYLFIGLIYWVLCYAMSLASQRLEQKLNVGQH